MTKKQKTDAAFIEKIQSLNFVTKKALDQGHVLAPQCDVCGKSLKYIGSVEVGILRKTVPAPEEQSFAA